MNLSARRSYLFLALLLLGAFAPVQAVEAQQTTAATLRFVDPGGACNGETPCDATIMEAVENAGVAPVEVHVFPGTYTEEIDLSRMNAALGISRGDLRLTAVDAQGDPAQGTVFLEGRIFTSEPFSATPSISGFTITAPDDAVNVTLGRRAGLVVRSGTITSGGHGVVVNAGLNASIKVDEMLIEQTGGDGLQVNLIGEGRRSELIVTNTVFDQNGGSGININTEDHVLGTLLYEFSITNSGQDGLRATFTGDSAERASYIAVTSPDGGTRNRIRSITGAGLNLDVQDNHLVNVFIDGLDISTVTGDCATLTVGDETLDDGDGPGLSIDINESSFLEGGEHGISIVIAEGDATISLDDSDLDLNEDNGLDVEIGGEGSVDLVIGDTGGSSNEGSGVSIVIDEGGTLDWYLDNEAAPGGAAPLVGNGLAGVNLEAGDTAVVNVIIEGVSLEDNNGTDDELIFDVGDSSETTVCLLDYYASDEQDPDDGLVFDFIDLTGGFFVINESATLDVTLIDFEPSLTSENVDDDSICGQISTGTGDADFDYTSGDDEIPIEKEASVSRTERGTIESFTVTITNNENFPIVDIVVEDPLPNGAQYIDDNAFSTGTVYDPDTGEWLIPSLGIGQSVAIVIEARINRTVTNTATVTAATFGTPGGSDKATIRVGEDNNDNNDDDGGSGETTQEEQQPTPTLAPQPTPTPDLPDILPDTGGGPPPQDASLLGLVVGMLLGVVLALSLTRSLNEA